MMWLFRESRDQKRRKKDDENHRRRIEKNRELALMKIDNQRRMETTGNKVVKYALEDSDKSHHFTTACREKLAAMHMGHLNKLINRQLKLEHLCVSMQEDEFRNYSHHQQRARCKNIRSEMKDLSRDLKKCPPKKMRAQSERLTKLREASKYKNEIIQDLFDYASDGDGDDNDRFFFGTNNLEAVQEIKHEALESDLLKAPNVIALNGPHTPADTNQQSEFSDTQPK